MPRPGFWNWDNRESLIEYDDDDRFEKDERAAAKATSLVFSHAAKARPAPLIAELEPDVQEAKLHTCRTMATLLRRAEPGAAGPELPAAGPASLRASSSLAASSASRRARSSSRSRAVRASSSKEM